jgi:glycosyltransferase involved in cell wall biosynthesis
MRAENLVSTIIPVHNRAKMLRDAVSSVLAQSYRPIEIIIVDDGSTDETTEVVEELAASHDEVRSVYQGNAGPGAAREAGRQLACGAFIQYLDSDDLLLPTKFELQVEALRRNPGTQICYGKTRFYQYGEQPSNIPWKRTGERIPRMFPSFLSSRWWDTSTPLYRREIIDAAGAWLPISQEEDWEYDCRIASKDISLSYCDEFVSDTRLDQVTRLSGSESSTSLAHRAEAHRHILRHASAAGITPDFPEMQRFARELFLLARQCGAAGREKDSKSLFKLVRQASRQSATKKIEFFAYESACRLFGWKAIGELACRMDRWRL